MAAWTQDDIGDQSSKTFVITGANSGLGYEASRLLAARGARVVMACRNLDKGEEAAARIRAAHPEANVELSELDLANLASVRSFAERFAATSDKLDVLCNNAGIMAIPRRETADGFEMQLGTNHLGHFALTGLLLERLEAADAARVVTVSSMAHHSGKIRFDDLQSRSFYSRWLAYGQSKLANLLFTYELQRRLAGAGRDTIAVAAHPGYSATNLQFSGGAITSAMLGLTNKMVQNAEMGTLPSLYAATANDVSGGDYYGPGGFMEIGGYPKKVKSNRRSHDRDVQRRLFEVSEELTGVRYAL